jgi:hypothetical protein
MIDLFTYKIIKMMIKERKKYIEDNLFTKINNRK